MSVSTSTSSAPRPFGAHLKALRDASGFTQEELATISGLSVHAISALERGERRRPQLDTVRALASALDLDAAARAALQASARGATPASAVDEMIGAALPLPPTPLVGREHEVRRLGEWLGDPGGRLITLIGPGGVGKTRLALELGYAAAADGGIRVLFVPLAVVSDAAFVASAIAEALGLADVSARDLPARARAACLGHQALLILDNFEHVLDAAPIVADLLTAVTALRIVVTSRAALRVRGEREFGVGPLSVEDVDDRRASGDDDISPAVRLFVSRVQDVIPDFRLTPASREVVTTICRRLDALPLALELAAPWMKVLSPDDLLARLDHVVLLASQGPRDLPERQRTINATVAWSYQLLTAEEQRAFRHLGALPGLFPIDAAAAVLAGDGMSGACRDEALAAAASLIDKSLLIRADNSVVSTCPLYQMLETIRAYAAQQLAAAEERDSAMDGLVGYCRREAAMAYAGLAGPDQVEWLDRVREDLESYRSALSWLLECGRIDEAAEIAWALGFFWHIRGHSVEGLQWYERVLASPPLSAGAEARALIGVALMSYSQGQVQVAQDALTRAVGLALESDETELLGHAEHLRGYIELAAGNVDEARAQFARSVEIFRFIHSPWGIGSSLAGMAWVAMASGEDARIEPLLEEASTILTAAGPWFMSLVRYLRAVVAIRQADADRAVALMRESLEQIRNLHDKFAFVFALVPLSWAAILKGNDHWAAKILGARDTIGTRFGIVLTDRSTQDLRDDAERAVRAKLGPDRWAEAYAAGCQMSIEGLLADIERWQ